jgi:hypothetical protein
MRPRPLKNPGDSLPEIQARPRRCRINSNNPRLSFVTFCFRATLRFPFFLLKSHRMKTNFEIVLETSLEVLADLAPHASNLEPS